MTSHEPPAQTQAEPRVLLIGRPGCHLCDDARVVVQSVCGEAGTAWAEVSIDDDPLLAEQYWERIPVIMLDGRPFDFWRVDEQRLRSALQE